LIIKKARFRNRALYFESGSDLLSHDLSIIVSSAQEVLTSVFEMGTGGAPPASPPENLISSDVYYTVKDRIFQSVFDNRREMKRGQVARSISTGQLNTLLHLHLQPIDVVVYHRPSEGLLPGRPNLGVGFTLRCLQRLSLPDIATRHCHWHDNRNTRGLSIPVLSY
jgi:hypothetical protein